MLGRFLFYFCILLFVSQSQCSHCSFLPHSNLLKIKSKIVSSEFIEPTYSDLDFYAARSNPKLWGRIVESAIGAHIMNCAYMGACKVYYWRKGDYEVDFVLVRNSKVVAIEVKSNEEKDTKGLHVFDDMFHPHRTLVVGRGGLPIETFLKSNLLDLF